MIQVVVCSPVPALRAGLSALIEGDPDCTVWAAAASLEDVSGPLPEGCVVVSTEAVVTEAVLTEAVVSDPGGKDGAASEPVEVANLLQGAALLLVTDEPAGFAPPLDGLHGWGVLAPEASAEALRAAVHALSEGLTVYSPELLAGISGGGMVQPVRRVGGGHDLIEPLTERETQVLLRLAQGFTNKQTALALGISEHTVKFHVSSIYSKLGVTNRAEAVREGARLGLVPL